MIKTMENDVNYVLIETLQKNNKDGNTNLYIYNDSN
jgi:hypothetical protein